MKGFKYLVYIAIIAVLGYFFVNLVMNPSETDENEEDVVEEQEEETEESSEETDEEVSDYDFSEFSEEDQTVGENPDGVEYTLKEISDEEMDGFHRFTFDLESDLEEIPVVEASLVSSGGYIRLVIDSVTTDQSGIGYNSQRDIDTEGITRLYHDVTANESEEVYNIGIVQDTIFFLYVEDEKVILDVKYPGEAEVGEYDDPEDFGTDDIELGSTNTEGDSKIVGYSWGVENGAVKFIWETSSSSGNPTPPTAAVYDEDANTVTVTFSDLVSDSILASTGTFEMEMSRAVDQITGSIDGDDHVFFFELNTDIEYKIYRETSPNQVVIEIR
jgi:hypothetical protein